QQQVPHVALGVEDESRDACLQRLLEEDDAEARLARPGHAQDGAVGREVAGLDDHRVGAGLPGRRIDTDPQSELGHGGSLRAAGERRLSSRAMAEEPRITSGALRPLVLVPGACLGGWAWRDVAARLRLRGHEVYPVTLTGLGDRVHLGSA